MSLFSIINNTNNYYLRLLYRLYGYRDCNSRFVLSSLKKKVKYQNLFRLNCYCRNFLNTVGYSSEIAGNNFQRVGCTVFYNVVNYIFHYSSPIA